MTFARILSVCLLLLVLSPLARAAVPDSWDRPSLFETVPIEQVDYPALDMERIAIEDEFDEALGKPPRFAVPRALSRSPLRDGVWVDLPDGRSVWRLEVRAERAVSLNFGFRDVHLPEGARLFVYAPDTQTAKRAAPGTMLGPYGPEINAAHREFWTPILVGSAAVIELSVPSRMRDRLSLELVQVGQGYRAFGLAALEYRQAGLAAGPGKSAQCDAKDGGGARSGSCNMDVACLAPDDPWNDPRRSVGAYSRNGSLACTGSLLNNTAQDRRMLFATATHCGVTAGNAPSVVVYWNYEWPICRTPGDSSGTQVNPPDPAQSSSGAQFLAATTNPFGGSCSVPGNCSDMNLIELDDPPDPAWDLFWAGWDRRDLVASCGPQVSNSSTENLCASIHHPGVDEKRITFVETDIVEGNISGAQGVHWHPFWDPTPPVVLGIPEPRPPSIPAGVTEPGSSGSPLYNADQRFIGVLSGGPAACGATGANLSDFYGQLAHAWDGLGSPATRMRDHLDPLALSPGFIDGIGVSPFGLAATPAAVAACTDEGSVAIAIDVSADPGFTDPVSLGVTGQPAGSTVSLSTNPVIPPGSSTLTVGSLVGAAVGTYSLNVEGAAVGQDPQNLVVPFELSSATPPAASLVAPADGALNVSATPVFEWSAATQATSYLLEVATDPGFGSIVLSEGVAGTSFQPTGSLPTSTELFWRVTPSNACGIAPTSPVRSFTTIAAPGDCSPGSVAETYYFDDMESGGSGWTHQSLAGQDTWALDTSDANSPVTSWRADNLATVSDQVLISPSIVVPAGVSPLTLQYYSKRDLEPNGASACYDGGRLEYSTDGGSNWVPVAGSRLETNPYTGTVSGCCSNPLAGQAAWCGAQDWTRTVVDLGGLEGLTLQFRFRLATDSSVAADDWHIDDVRVQSCVVVTEEIFADGFESPSP